MNNRTRTNGVDPAINGTGFIKGDFITVTQISYTPGVTTIRIIDATLGNLVLVGPSTNQILTYTVPADTSDTIQTGYTSGALGNTETVTCIPAVSTTTNTTPTDSTNIRSLQTNISKSVSNTSATNTTNAIGSGINSGFDDGGTSTNVGPGGGFINFAAAEPRAETERRVDEAFSALAYAGNPSKAPTFNKASPRLDRDWSAWGDIRGIGWTAHDSSGAGNDLKGNQINLTLGVGRKLNRDTLIGAIVGYEYFKYDVASLNGSLKGDGETIGTYFARRLGSNLRFDAALAWSNVNYSATSGAAAGSFKGSRWLASTSLTATHKLGIYTLEPSAALYMLWERQNAWTDSLGTAQDSRNFSAGRTALGSKVGRSFEASGGWMLAPYVGLYGDWRFASDNAIPTGTQVANIGTGWSGRVTSGVIVTAKNGTTLLFNGEYGGLGATYKIWSGNARATVPF